MKIEIKNFRGVEDAAIALAPLALVCGTNASGKSSIAQAVAACLTGDAVPLAIKKNESGMLVRAGTGGSEVTLTADSGRIRITYPNAKVKSEGTPPSASRYAAGLASVLDMDQRSASHALLEYLKAEPSSDDLRAALAKLGLMPEQQAQLVANVETLGWDGAHASVKDRGTKLKGQWEGITGERYGSKKAREWIPANYASDLEGASEESLQAVVTEAREFLEAAIASAAIGQDERDRLQSLVDRRTETEAALTHARAEVDALKKELDDAQAVRNALPGIPAQQRKTPCPHCGGEVVIRGAALAIPEDDISADEVQRRHAAQRDADQSVFSARDRLSDANVRVVKAEHLLADIDAAERKLADQPETSDGGDVEAARENSKRAEERLTAFMSKSRADRIAASIETNQEIVGVLASDGLRLEKLRLAIENFNRDLAGLSETARWGIVELSDDLSVTYARRPWALLSESERFRARATLQVAMAQIDRSSAMIVDAADILDRAGRNGLFRLLGAAGLPALVCMTMNNVEDAPNLKDRGNVYWLQDAAATALGFESAQ